MIAIKILCALLCGYADLQRGKNLPSLQRLAFKLLYCLLASVVCLGVTSPPVIAAFAAFFLLGMSPGWGEPLGAMLYNHKMNKHKLEWWQRGKLLSSSPVAACTFRGFLWALPCCIVAFWDISALSVLSMAVSFPLSIYVTTLIMKKRHLKDAWQTREIIGGTMFGVLALCLSLAIQALHA